MTTFATARSMIAGESRIWQVDVAMDPFDSYRSTDRIQLDVVKESRSVNHPRQNLIHLPDEPAGVWQN